MDRPGGGHAARVVDRAVQPAELRHGRGGQPLNLPLHGDVGGDEERAAAAVAQPFRGPLTNVPRRPPITTAAPSETARPATARPMPVAPPVTITTFDARRPAMNRACHNRAAGPRSCP
ncbi:MAG TPA: hypothetical protein VF256_04705, partial [Streptosporangiaceae bacterium]